MTTRRQFLRSSVIGAIGLTVAVRPTLAEGKKRVACSTPLLADIISNVTGDAAEVYSIMPATVDPHTWEASPQDIQAVEKADIFISIGKHLEPFVEAGGWRRAIKDAGIPEFPVAEHVTLIKVDMVIDHGDHTHDLRDGDPHIWMDPLKIVEAVPKVAEQLGNIDSANAATYTRNADAYVKTLTTLNDELTESFAKIPEDRRKLIVFHNAFTYFCARYGFEVVEVVIKNPDADVSAKDLAQIADAMDKTGVKVIFTEPQFNVDALSEFVKEHDVTLGELLTDSFSERVTTYTDLLKYDRDSLIKHLA